MAAALVPWLFAAVTVAASIAVAFAIAREVARGERRHRREEIAALAFEFRSCATGRLAARRLRRSARAAAEATFWTALEQALRGMSRRGRAVVSAALERNHHGARERRLLRTEPPERRQLAAARLGLLRSRRSRAALRRALRRGPESVTVAALRALARDRDLRALEWALDHPQRLARRSAAVWVALLRAFGARAVPSVASRLRGGIGHEPLQRAAVAFLGIARHRPPAPGIAALLRDGPPEVRVAAARALGRMRARDQAAALRAALDDPDWPVRALAAWALGHAGDRGAAAPLAMRLTDASWWVRRHSAYALAALGERATLAAIAGESPDPYARQMAQEALDQTALSRTG
jgi:hypothetical protein